MTRDSNGRLSEKEARAGLLCLDERDRTILLALHAVRFVTLTQAYSGHLSGKARN